MAWRLASWAAAKAGHLCFTVLLPASAFQSADVSKAIGQGHEQPDNCHDDAGLGLRGRPGIVTYHPRATILIGRSEDWSETEYRALAGLKQSPVGVSIMTYDQLLAQGDQLIWVSGAEVDGELT